MEVKKMPCGDGTGPLGTGPIGLGLGPCGKGLRKFRRFAGFGRCFRYKYIEPVILSEKEKKKILEEELKEIELEKQEIEKRLKKIK